MLLVTAVVLIFFGFKDAILLVGACFAYWDVILLLLIRGETVAVVTRLLIFLVANPEPVFV